MLFSPQPSALGPLKASRLPALPQEQCAVHRPARYFVAGGVVEGKVTFGAGTNGTMPNFGYASDG